MLTYCPFGIILNNKKSSTEKEKQGEVSMAFCTNCGRQLAEGAKFCFECGAKVGNSAGTRAEARKNVYDGEIYRCPNCGDILDAYESVCQTCGYERRGAKATGSVQELAKKIEQIELQRPLQKKLPYLGKCPSKIICRERIGK